MISIATLPDHRLVFHKRSVDGSAKCDAAASDDGEVLGVVYEISENELPELRKAEGSGKGYDEATVEVTDANGDAVAALTYVASSTHVKNGLPVYSWYYDFVLMGCREHEFPSDYVNMHVRSVATIEDPDRERDERSRAEVEGDPIRSILAT